MTVFTYSAVRQNGTTMDGEREAENEIVLARLLKQEGLFLLEAHSKNTVPTRAWLKKDFHGILSFIRPITLVERMFFTRNLAVMVNAGFPLTKALEVLADETHNNKFKKIIRELASTITAGKSFTEALSTHQQVFAELYIHMVEVGESTGKLVLILRLLARQMKKDYDLRRRVRGALIYPTIILSVLAFVGALMMIYVVPTLATTLQELGSDLPLTTRVLIAMSNFITRYTIFLGIIVIIVIGLFFRILKTHTGKYIFHGLILHLPVFGKLLKQFNMARFCRTLSYLITSGVSIVRALEVTARVLGNTHYRAAVHEAASVIQKGTQLNEILLHYPALFQPMTIYMIKVGEETGQTSKMLLRLALFFEEDIANTTKNLSSIIEPVLMVVIGVAVAFFALSVLQPIYGSLNTLAQ